MCGLIKMKEKGAQNLQPSEEWQEASCIFKRGEKRKIVLSLLYLCSISILSTGKSKKKSNLLSLSPYWLWSEGNISSC